MGSTIRWNLKTTILIIIIVSVLIFLAWMGATYNRFVTLEEDIDAQWSEMKNQDKRKMDLIPQLVNQSSQYQQFEKTTLENVTRLRNQWLGADSDLERDEISEEMNSYLGGIQITFEAYPELQAVGPLRDVMDEMAGTENRRTYARTMYIEKVRDYNIAIKKFPAVMVAGMFGFEEKENLFEET